MGWRGGAAQRRFAANYWVYPLGVVIHFAFYALLQEPRLVSGDIGILSALGRRPVLPETTLWYVFGLAVFPLVIVAAQGLRVPRGRSSPSG
jgi:hypothetical protein